jgi:hypothetical protein
VTEKESLKRKRMMMNIVEYLCECMEKKKSDVLEEFGIEL